MLLIPSITEAEFIRLVGQHPGMAATVTGLTAAIHYHVDDTGRYSAKLPVVLVSEKRHICLVPPECYFIPERLIGIGNLVGKQIVAGNTPKEFQKFLEQLRSLVQAD